MFLDKFRLYKEKEDLHTVVAQVEAGVAFRGTNLYILIFAIFVASLGLSVNSTAVIIGAMLISPLMGPIMGIGLGIGIYDVALIRKSISNYLFATGVALTTSTIFFLLSPLDDAHSEILARISPNIYDVLIALFGGFAGIIATSSKQKGNVIPGVAIATALMPPLCTAGYGLATLQMQYFVGAFYLFIINTVFIALATFITVRLFHLPAKPLQSPRAEKIAHRIVWAVVFATLLPSLYLGYDLVQQNSFLKNANRFVTNEAHVPNDYLLNKKIDTKTKHISLIFGGREILPAEILQMKNQMVKYGLDSSRLEIKQGFAYLSENKDIQQDDRMSQLSQALALKEADEKKLQSALDSIRQNNELAAQLFTEIKAQQPGLSSAIVQRAAAIGDSTSKLTTVVILSLSSKPSTQEKTKLEDWLKARLQQKDLLLFFR